MSGFVAIILNWALKPHNAVMLGVALLVAALGFQSWRVDHLKKDLGGARSALLDPVTHYTWSSEYGQCKASLDRQGAAVAALKADGDRRAAQLAAAVQGASRAADAASGAASRILAAKPKGDQCARMLAADAAILKEYQ
jgi:hypothetical protein